MRTCICQHGMVVVLAAFLSGFMLLLICMSFVGCSRGNGSRAVVIVADGSGQLRIDGKVVTDAEGMNALALAQERSQGRDVPTTCFGTNTPWSAVDRAVRLSLLRGNKSVCLVETNTQRSVPLYASFYDNVIEMWGSEPQYVLGVMEHVTLTDKGFEHDGAILTRENVSDLVQGLCIPPGDGNSLLAVVVTRGVRIDDVVYLLGVSERVGMASLRFVDEDHAPKSPSIPTGGALESWDTSDVLDQDIFIAPVSFPSLFRLGAQVTYDRGIGLPRHRPPSDAASVEENSEDIKVEISKSVSN